VVHVNLCNLQEAAIYVLQEQRKKGRFALKASEIWSEIVKEELITNYT
jgi:hypothetical protein